MPDNPEAPVEGNPEAQPDAPEQASGQAEQPEYFDEKFDPATLPDELRPALKQMRDAFSQKTQAIAQERQQLREAQELYDAIQDPEKAPDALRRFGYDFEDPDDQEDDYDDDPQSELEQRLARLETQREAETSQAQQAQQKEAEVAFINAGLADLQQRTGRQDFSDEEFQALGLLSEKLRDSEGLPDVQAAYELIYTGVLPNERKRWVESKRSPQAPAGRPGSQAPDLDDPRARQDYMAQRLAEIDEAD